MRIAMLSPIAWRTPPRHYGPWEQVVSLLTEGLVSRGIDVTLFATADSQTKGKLHATCPRPYEEDKTLSPKVWECLHISELFERADEFDLIHNHFDFLPLTYSDATDTPVVSTIHGFSSPQILPVYKKYNDRCYYVSISNADRSPELDYIATVYHGIDLKQFTFQEKGGDYLLFFGRLHHDKGAKEAIRIAKQIGMKLVMAGVIQDTPYFDQEVLPHLDGKKIFYEGSLGPELRDKFLGGACALLHPINFAEPFGLSVVEANACGTPVIAFSKGSMPELIKDGENGFLVSDVTEAVKAVSHIGDLDRRQCREWVEQRFSKDRMVEDYLKVYERVIEKTRREDHRPWGYYQVLSDEPDHKVKRIVVYPGKRLSLQFHHRRAEHWMVINGQGVVTRGNEEITVSPGKSVDIPQGAAHRIQNTGSRLLVFIEVQQGDYFGEDDIVRIEDDYGRA
ncbi:glycosyltransferase [bacterium]|nr:glycosyltransferase [bacterium]MBU1487049.1 glycosyltransferase [bacterium]